MHAGHHVFAHLPHTHFFKLPEEVAHFYALAFVRTVLSVTGGLFFPLFVYKSTGSLTITFLYMLLSQGLARLPVRTFNLWVLRRHGVEWAMFLSILLGGTEYFLAYFAGMGIVAVFFYGILEGVSGALYWDAYHTSFGIFGREKDAAEEVAGLQILQNITAIVLPLISATVIAYLGFHAFYALVFVSTLAASLWLLKMFGKTHHVLFTMQEVLTVPFRDLHVSDGIQYGFTWVIPIFLYIVFGGSVLLFGALKTTIGAAMALFSFAIARYYDRKRAFGLGRITYLGNGFWTSVLVAFPAPLVASITEIGRGITNTFGVAITATLYRIVKHQSRALTVGRSFYVSMGKTIAFTVAIIVSAAAEYWHAIPADPVFITRALIAGTLPFALLSAYLYGKMERAAESYDTGE